MPLIFGVMRKTLRLSALFVAILSSAALAEANSGALPGVPIFDTPAYAEGERRITALAKAGQTQRAIKELFDRENIVPSIVVHRGHSYYVHLTINEVRPGTRKPGR